MMTELNPYGIKYEPRTAIKGQVLADFIAEFTLGVPTQSDSWEGWILNVDGALNYKEVGIGLILTTPIASIINQSLTLSFPTTNNEAEYEAVMAGLIMAMILGIIELEV